MSNFELQNDSDESGYAKPSRGNLTSWLHLNDDHPLLPLSIFSYVPVSVLLNILGVIALVAMGYRTLLDAFLTNVTLNGTIIIIMIVGVGMSILGNIRLWRTGLYLKRLELVSLQFRIRDEDLDGLQRSLQKVAQILDCKNMQNLLDNLRSTGALNVTDNDARMIKSKVGARINRGRSKVTFLSGLLVMLGLLGTFLGLLGTIDAVGEAMAGMANIGSVSGDGEDTGMSGFISSLAAPLQGMGLAFSSSLFGLSGSLLVGTIQYFSSGAQDTFIESFSRWLDEQIPGVSMAKKSAGMRSDSPPVADAELKAWIVGFIQSSQNTQRELADVVDAILISADASARSMEHAEKVLDGQAVLVDTLSMLNGGVSAMVRHQQQLESVFTSDTIRTLIASQELIGGKLEALDDSLVGFAKSQGQSVASLERLSRTLEDQIPKHVLQTSDRLNKALGRINDKMVRLSREELVRASELHEQVQRLEKLVAHSEKRTVQRDQRAHSDMQNQFRRESDQLKQVIGANITATVKKDVIPFIAKEQKELKKIARLIDKQYGRRQDDKQSPDVDVA